jgi:5'-methylthioadenosine phosphorylase
MDEINAVLASSAAKVLAILDELVHTRATFPDAEEADGVDRAGEPLEADA